MPAGVDSGESTATPLTSSSPASSSMTSPASAEKEREAKHPAPQPPAAVVPAPPAEGQPQKPKRQITLLPSVFEGRPPVLFFHYTEACGAKQRPMERAVPADIDGPRLFYSHTDAVHEYNAVVNILRQGGLYRVRPDTQRWLLLWSNHPSPEVLLALKPTQRTNHFRGSWHLGRKDLIWRNLSRMQRRFGRPYQITPQAYVLPKASASWEAARARQPNALWIWKPCSQSCGRGIRIMSSALSPDEAKELGRKRGVVQRYVPNPLLIYGYKFDLRIYVVVLSYDPLKVYINDEGLVRLATEKYSSSPDTLEQRTMHLTNYSVNKASPAFVQNRDGRDGEANTAAQNEFEPKASKWSLSELQEHFQKEGLDYQALFDRIKDLVIKTLIAVESPIQAEWYKALDSTEEEGWAATGAAGAHRGSCFEMYGFDVLVDSDLKPWLLEVNICPSLSSGSPLDKRIKTKLVADTLTLVGLRPPRSMWRRCRGGSKRPSSEAGAVAGGEEKEANGEGASAGCKLGAAALAACAEKLADCEEPLEALALFDETAWETVLDAHDEDMRSGGLERIYPTADSAKYTQYIAEESYFNLVLRKWHEAGGGELFKAGAARRLLPPWVPRKICFSQT